MSGRRACSLDLRSVAVRSDENLTGDSLVWYWYIPVYFLSVMIRSCYCNYLCSLIGDGPVLCCRLQAQSGSVGKVGPVKNPEISIGALDNMISQFKIYIQALQLDRAGLIM